MRKHVNIFLGLATALLLGGCENNFDPQIYGNLMPGDFPSTEKEYEAYMMTCYLPFTTVWTYDMASAGLQHGWHIPAGGVIRMFDSTSDINGRHAHAGDEWGRYPLGDFTNAQYYWRGTVSDANSINHFPKTAQITRYTEIIDVLMKSDLNDAVKRGLIGEARLCRGLMMYYLLHNFGPVRVVLDPTKILDSATLSNVTRPTLDEMCGWIAEDFEYAVANAPETAKEQGRFTRDYARYCLMRHCLNEGDHMPGYYDRGLEMYSELNTGKYRLFDQGENPYAAQFINANKFNCEVIAAISCNSDADGNPMHGNFNPFMMLALPGDVAEQDPFPRGGGWLQAFSIDKTFYETFEASDLRRKTIVTSYVAKDGVTVTRNNFGVRWNGYIVNKWPQETATTFQGQDIPLARWADVLLMYAELSARKSKNVSQDAVNAVNLVRNRAGLSGLTSDATASLESFLDAILTERGHELMYEGCRKIDLIRFNVYAQKMYQTKQTIPTSQYIPLPNYAVDQAKASGIELEQEWHREGWAEDIAKANPSSI